MRCRYVGGSAQEHPNNATQLARGLQYSYVSCTQGAACPSANGADAGLVPDTFVDVEETATLHVDKGDDQSGATVVAAKLLLCPTLP